MGRGSFLDNARPHANYSFALLKMDLRELVILFVVAAVGKPLLMLIIEHDTVDPVAVVVEHFRIQVNPFGTFWDSLDLFVVLNLLV